MERIHIYGTLGPACRGRETLKAMFDEGLDGMRLNLSHMTLAAAADGIEAYQSAARECGKEAALLIDLMGPELRIGALSAPLRLETGACVDADTIPFPEEVKQALTEDREILLDDGKLLLRVQKDGLFVLRGGVLESRKSIALPGVAIFAPALTPTDREHLRQARAYGVTGVMQPFVRSKEDLFEVRAALDAAGGKEIRLFAKIENRAGMEKLDELIPYCDEIVIARGDLGSAIPLWELPAAQKRIAAACRAAGRDFTVVTQMLDSMIHSPVPTRAEVSDIFNAVLDGAASVMLTGETATGAHPVAAIRYLAKTVREAEAYRKTLP